MIFVPVSANVLVNPESIDCIEQRNTEGTSVTYIWVGEKSYVLTMPIEEFLRSLPEEEQKQIWTG